MELPAADHDHGQPEGQAEGAPHQLLQARVVPLHLQARCQRVGERTTDNPLLSCAPAWEAAHMRHEAAADWDRDL